MNFRNPFKRLASKKSPESVSPTELSDQPSEQSSSWDDLVKLNPDASDTTFDDLAKVPFAGTASVTTASVVTPDEIISGPSPEELNSDTIKDSAERATNSPELHALKNFFKTDLRIKRELMQAAPQSSDDYDEASRMDYAEKAYRTFRDFRSDFASIDRDFGFSSDVSEATQDFFQRGAEDFALGNYNSGITGQIYRQKFTDLRPEFVEEVKDKCVGYTFGGNLSSLVDDSQTINELLHAYHSYIMNNESILQKVPVVDQKGNDYGYSITLRGDESPLSRQVFDALLTDLDVGDTDIIGADEHVMMMVRDRGHALTISAEPDQSKADQIWVEYNIPKLCNVEMIKSLPGLSGYTDNGARGGFFADRNELGTKVADFIGQVPTDDDMSKPGGALYGRF